MLLSLLLSLAANAAGIADSLIVSALRNNINCYLFSVLRKGSVLLFTLGPGG